LTDWQSNYWGEVPRELMKQINEESKRSSWREALEKFLSRDYPTIYHYVTNARRADWRIFLPFGKESTVLDLGSGWGTLACAIAPYCKKVIALEGVPERVEFIKTRSEQSDITNIIPIQADFLDLPFCTDTFDAVIANGVLEWVALGHLDTAPDMVQKDFLINIRRLMKQGGWLYVGIENRFGFNLLLGGQDHTGLPFTSLVPRRMASLYMRLRSPKGYLTDVTQSEYRTYTYHASGYRRLLQDAGYHQVDILWANPGYNLPTAMGYMDDANSFSYFTRYHHWPNSKIVKSISFIFQRIFPSRGVIHFVPAFAIFAQA